MPLDFDIALEEEHVRMKNKDGDIEHYMLREAKGSGRKAYMKHITKCVEFGANESVKVNSVDGIYSKLLIHCVFRKDPPEGLSSSEISEATTEDVRTWGEHAVTEQEIDNWPSRVQDALYEKARIMSKILLSQEEEELEKN
jgi:hypothetical protein